MTLLHMIHTSAGHEYNIHHRTNDAGNTELVLTTSDQEEWNPDYRNKELIWLEFIGDNYKLHYAPGYLEGKPPLPLFDPAALREINILLQYHHRDQYLAIQTAIPPQLLNTQTYEQPS